MKRISNIFFIMCMFCAMIMAQDITTQSAIQEINQIKRNSEEFYFSEATSQTWEEALDNAKTLLSAQIELWAKTNQSTEDAEVFIARASEHLFEIKATRGQLFRAFVYVRKSDVLALSSNDKVLVIPTKSENTPSVTLVTPIQDDTSEMGPAEKVSYELTKGQQEEMPIPTHKLTEKNSSTEKYELSPFENEMISVSSFDAVSDFIRNLQGSNKISKIGKYADLPQNLDCYLFVYNPQGEIPAYLHKSSQGLFNLKTKSMDDIKNYKGCGAIWFSLR